ncbi:hypothetical protein ACHAXA_005253 [Cyclostephanos tholiformis]|uniref:Vesicle transport protein n=1 Tax=Cyclostephanos tholiformis TaxID=382380 RepID=A0ABD3R4S7_9STRA
MSRYIRLPSDQADPFPPLAPPSPSSPSSSSSSTPVRRPPPSAFLLFSSLFPPSSSNGNNGIDIDIVNDHGDFNNGNSVNWGMLASLKETANNAVGGLRENVARASGSVRAGLGMPVPNNDEIVGMADDNADAESQSSRILEEVAEYCPKMTYQQADAIYGFIICFTCGYLTTFASFRLFVKLVAGNPAPFVFLYTTGNVMSLMSSMFLSGPSRQFRLMFDERRRTTSISYLAALAASITVCFLPLPTGPRIALLVSREY